jgi:hypothetical protein
VNYRFVEPKRGTIAMALILFAKVLSVEEANQRHTTHQVGVHLKFDH